MTIGLLLIATHKYKQFVAPLVEDVKKYFLPNHQIEVHLFTDDVECPAIGNDRVKIVRDLINGWRWPQITLYRYKIFTYKNDVKKQYPGVDYLFYMDVDMSIKKTIGDEILKPVVATLHPGFYKGGGSWGDNQSSMSYTQPFLREKYYAGGFQGGKSEFYYHIAQLLAQAIEFDEQRGIMAEWHDETHWNRFLSEYGGPITKLSPAYCMVEQEHLRVEWGISHMAPYIIALAKNHEEMRK
jgi:hypothetical protein